MIKQRYVNENGIGHWVLENSCGDVITCDNTDQELRDAKAELIKKEREYEEKMGQ